jgi:hypothetical protein
MISILGACVSTHIGLYPPPGAAHLAGCVPQRLRAVTTLYNELRGNGQVESGALPDLILRTLCRIQMRWGRMVGQAMRELGRDKVAGFRCV